MEKSVCHRDKIMTSSDAIIGTNNDSQEMLKQAKFLAQSTTDLIQEIKRVAEAQTDSPLRVNSFQHKNCDWKNNG